MFYNFNRFYQVLDTDGNWAIQEKNEINANDLKISPEEIAKIEWIDKDLSANEEMKWLIDQESKKFLVNLISESKKILENQWSDKQEKIRALYSLLKIQQILYPWSIEPNIDMSGDMTSDGLLSIMWNNPAWFTGVIWQSWVDFVKSFITDKEEDVKTNVRDWKDIKDVNDWISLVKAKTYMQNLLGNWNGVDVSSMYSTLSAHFDDDNFIPAVNALIDEACKKLNINLNTNEATVTFDVKTKKSDKIKAFQKAMVSWYKANGEVNMLSYNKNTGIDWQLWWKTLKVILDKSWVTEEFSFNITGEGWLKEWNERKEIEDIWREFDNLPTDIVALRNFWKFENWKFVFHDKWDKDCIQSNPNFPNDKFVKIWWKKYYIWEISDDNPEKDKNPNYFKQIPKPYIWLDDEGNRVQFVWTRICFWNFDGNDLIDWSEILLDKDWKQIKSTETGPTVTVWDKDEKIVYTKIRWKEKKWTDDNWEENEREGTTSTFEAKWRFEFWDTKRLNNEQLDALINNGEALVKVLNKCILLYSETNHKPSEIWRYNLSNIIVATLKKYDDKWYSDILGQLWWIEDRKWIVQKFFGLKHWMFSNPKNEIKWDTEKKYPEITGVKYEEEKNQWDRICNALKYLSAIVDKKKK